MKLTKVNLPVAITATSITIKLDFLCNEIIVMNQKHLIKFQPKPAKRQKCNPTPALLSHKHFRTGGFNKLFIHFKLAQFFSLVIPYVATSTNVVYLTLSTRFCFS